MLIKTRQGDVVPLILDGGLTRGGVASTVVELTGETGRIVPDDQFTPAIREILADPDRHAEMRKAARAYALTASWDSVFEGVYAAYQRLTPRWNRARPPIESQPARTGSSKPVRRSSANGFSLSLIISQPFPRSTPPSVPAMVTPSSESFADSHARPFGPHARME